MSTIETLIPITASDAEQAAALAEVGAIHGALRDLGEDVVCSIVTTPDGDLLRLEFDDRPLAGS
jgi:hypothetical protein